MVTLERIVLVKRFVTVCVVVLVAGSAVFVVLNSAGWVDLRPNPVPQVIPSLREWDAGAGSFVLDSASRIVVDRASAAQLTGTAHVFQGDLLAMTGHRLRVVTGSTAGKGDFFLTLSSADQGMGKEGYVFIIGDSAAISANTSVGVFYGTRTALQILAQDPSQAHIPKGTARDYPQYQERGFMLDVGRKYFSIQSLEDYVKFMAWYKMNDFHIHFNDNAVDAGTLSDWMHQYSAFRLNSGRFPGLAAKDGSYTQQDIRALQDVANQYAVTITPEIDAPAHDMAFTQYRPDLASPTANKEFLNLGNPATYTFLNSIWDEFLPWFDATQVNIGADEYDPFDANRYRQFINTYDAYLRGKGKSVQMWGSLSEMNGTVTVNTDIVTDLWDNQWANPVDMVRQGFNVINANDNLLYIVPKSGYFHDYLDTKLLYQKWEPYIFDLSNPRLNLEPSEAHLLGGMFAEWNDRLGSVISDADVYSRVRPAMQTLSQKLWSGPTLALSYEEFQQLAQQIGGAPGTHLPGAQATRRTPHAPTGAARGRPGTFSAADVEDTDGRRGSRIGTA
jgi:hexosaminidase